MFGVARCALLLLSWACVISNAQPGNLSEHHNPEVPNSISNSTLNGTSSHSPSKSTATSTTASTATCISRTVNYITHTLPQQCLRTNRVVANGTLSSRAFETHSTEPEIVSDGIFQAETAGPSSETETPADAPGAPDALNANRSSIHVAAGTQHESSAPPLSAATTSTSISAIESVTETDSPLDNANFLSFDEWRKQNLAKVGQSPENLGQERLRTGDRERPGINNALDTLGEESEIDLDFAGFGGSQPTPSVASDEDSASSRSSEAPADESGSPATNLLRSKDAGKTCKERTNYASFDCAATMLKSNKECKSASSVLVENKDSYMLNTCSAENKFFIIELCNDILIDTVVLANYEFFSSIFRHFRVSVSDRYPVKMDKWKDLGTFEARNTREVQAFLVENPLIWARYLKIEFLTHWGNEYYCPVSLIRVHGKTMMQEFRQQEEIARGEVDEDPSIEAEVIPLPPVAQEPPAVTNSSEGESSQESSVTQPEHTRLNDGNPGSTKTSITLDVGPLLPSLTISDSSTPYPTKNLSIPSLGAPGNATCAASIAEKDTSLLQPTPNSGARSTPQLQISATSESSILTTGTKTSRDIDIAESASSQDISSATPVRTLSSRNVSTSVMTEPATSSPMSSSTGPAASIISPISKPAAVANGTSSASSNSSRVATSTSSTSSPQPSTQESFFKSISKRLQQLESNSTLSLQYIEEQSRILRDAFNKVEKRQISATSNFLSHLNDTVMNELHGFRQAYDQLWQSTVIELEGQREQYQREMLALSTRLTLVADELVWQKRMGIVQSTLLLLCLALALFTRQGNGYLEVPLMQQMMNKSQAALRSGWESDPNSPSSPASRSPVSLFRRKLWRSSLGQENGHGSDGTDNRPRTAERLEVQLEPPTPPTKGALSEDEDTDDEDQPVLQSSPATPNGTGEGLKRPPLWAGDGRDRSESPLRDLG